MQARRGELMDPLDGSAFIAVVDDRQAGLVAAKRGGSFSAEREAELRVLVVEPTQRRRGIGSLLLHHIELMLRRSPVDRAWLVTTNDNLEALAFYQRRKWRIAGVLPNAVDEARRTLKPSIARVAANGIPIRDELVLRHDLAGDLGPTHRLPQTHARGT
jgi:ribosomal protein S18 acetylase RimI-like enzyme